MQKLALLHLVSRVERLNQIRQQIRRAFDSEKASTLSRHKRRNGLEHGKAERLRQHVLPKLAKTRGQLVQNSLDASDAENHAPLFS